jgi:hypothetical protein
MPDGRPLHAAFHGTMTMIGMLFAKEAVPLGQPIGTMIANWIEGAAVAA